MKVNLNMEELEILHKAIAKETIARYEEKELAYKTLKDKELCDEYEKDLKAAVNLRNKIYRILRGEK